MTSSPATTTRFGLPHTRADEAFVFEALQCEIHRRPQDAATRVLSEIVHNRDAITVRSETDDGQQHEMFELAERAFSHGD
jgi:hypothetical protein